jgi:hypothetical protein
MTIRVTPPASPIRVYRSSLQPRERYSVRGPSDSSSNSSARLLTWHLLKMLLSVYFAVLMLMPRALAAWASDFALNNPLARCASAGVSRYKLLSTRMGSARCPPFGS